MLPSSTEVFFWQEMRGQCWVLGYVEHEETYRVMAEDCVEPF